MGGIIGIVGKTDIAPLLLESLAGFEDPRGNSCGLAVLGEEMGIDLRKDIGPVEMLSDDSICYPRKETRHRARAVGHPWGSVGGKCPSSSELRPKLRRRP